MKKVTFGAKPPIGQLPTSVDAWVSDREQNSDEPTKRFTFDVPVSLHRRIKSNCALGDKKMTDVIRDMLEREFPENTN